MKKITVLLAISALIFVSCGDKKKDEAPKKEINKTEKSAKPNDQIVKGQKLFAAKGCTACHHESTKIIGPSVKDIATIYNEKNGDLMSFLKGSSEAIADSDPSQIAIMKNNLDTMVKEISDEDLKAIATYMASVK